MAPHSSTPAWKIPWTEEPGRQQSMGLHRVGHDWAISLSLFTFHFPALEKEMATHSSVLAWRIPGTGEPGGLPSMGSHRVGHYWSNLAAAAVKNDVKHLSMCLFATCIYFLVKTCCSHFLNWDFYFPVVEFWFSLYIFIVNSLTYVWPPNTSSKLSLVFEVKWSLSVVSDSLRPHGL